MLLLAQARARQPPGVQHFGSTYPDSLCVPPSPLVEQKKILGCSSQYERPEIQAPGTTFLNFSDEDRPEGGDGTCCRFGTLTGEHRGVHICPVNYWLDGNVRSYCSAEKRNVLRKMNGGRRGSSVFVVGSFGKISVFVVGSATQVHAVCCIPGLRLSCVLTAHESLGEKTNNVTDTYVQKNAFRIEARETRRPPRAPECTDRARDLNQCVRPGFMYPSTY